ncbi:MAG: DegT/DnrJ/EryC1/StrS family aminotransferase [Alphaproteobacteria bacterium]|nr:DegT/DnrJ/EryC1/StrS family aminotransferase [Alphaproteobacteria bacterium]
MTDPRAKIAEGIAEWCRANHDYSFDPANPVVRLHEPTFGAEEIDAAVECLLTTRITMGPKVKGFEADFKAHLGTTNATMVNSGSSANLLAIAALANPETRDALRPGDEVIVPALSWSTTVWPLVQMGLVPVIVDIDRDTLNIDPNEVERAIGPKTRAVMPVHVYGNPCDMDALTDICQRRGLTLIEDGCEALGASYGGTPVCRFGRVGTFSFYYSHHITTLEGGICVSDDFELAETMRILRAHGWVREVEDKKRWTDRYPDIHERFLFVNLGYNLRATDVQGAFGSVQLPKLAGLVRQRQALAAYWRDALARFRQFIAPQEITPKGDHSWMSFAIKLEPAAPFTSAELMGWLEKAGIETRPIICGNVARQPGMKLYPHRAVGDLARADAIMDRAFSIGCHQGVDDAARAYVAETFARFFAARGLA